MHLVLLLEDRKARDIAVLDVRRQTDIADFMLIATGTSNRHVASIVSFVLRESKRQNIPVFGVEGQRSAEWVLVDFGDALLHVMQNETRKFYQIERLWSPLEQQENLM